MPKNPKPKLTLAERLAARLTVSRKEAADALGVDIQTVDGYIASRTLKASKLGKRGNPKSRVLITVPSILAMLKANEI